MTAAGLSKRGLTSTAIFLISVFEDMNQQNEGVIVVSTFVIKNNFHKYALNQENQK